MLKKRNLVLGVVRGYSFDKLKPFVFSLKNTAFNGDLVLLWNELSRETREDLQKHDVKLMHFSYRGSGALNSWSRFWPVLAPIVRLWPDSHFARKILKSIVHLMYLRFFVCRDFLAGNQNLYQNVLITDIRDVLFQADPFSGFKGGLLVFEEDPRIPLGDEKMCNSPWVEETFGREALSQIGGYPILCAGTTMGDTASIIYYLTQFENLVCRVNKIANGGDQGIHNYLCRGIMRSKAVVSKNGEGPILTMVPSLKMGVDFSVSQDGFVLNPMGLPVPVLHQYDRYPDLVESLIRKFAKQLL
jgi:hypothetical protein